MLVRFLLFTINIQLPVRYLTTKLFNNLFHLKLEKGFQFPPCLFRMMVNISVLTCFLQFRSKFYLKITLQSVSVHQTVADFALCGWRMNVL